MFRSLVAITSLVLLSTSTFASVLIARDANALPKRQEGTIPALLVSYKHNTRSIAIRQAGSQCPAGYFECSSGDGCCPEGYACGVFGGQEGCCPEGKTCNGIAGCPASTDTECSDGGCCSAGTTCCTDDLGNPKCCTGSSGTTTTPKITSTTSTISIPTFTNSFTNTGFTNTGFSFTTNLPSTTATSPATTSLHSGDGPGGNSGDSGSPNGAIRYSTLSSAMFATGVLVVLWPLLA